VSVIEEKIDNPENRRIKVLPPQEALKIAAGEVIDRPAALMREFIDNAVDSGAASIEALIKDGGISLSEVSDDGCGMSCEDLVLSCIEHATSKINNIDDLKSLKTLGFRGEALSSAAAVALLEIISSTGGIAHRLTVGPGSTDNIKTEPAARVKGTTVRAFNLFNNIPARKLFLKRQGSEAGHCKQVFIEKALAFPHIGFRFIQDGELLLNFMPENLKSRFADALLNGKQTTFLHQIAASGGNFSATIIVGGNELRRNDRRLQFVFANGRRINDYALQQTLEYGTQGWFPNGTHPIGAIFLEIDSAAADFNVHPAKKEARFVNSGEIHHSISSALQNFVSSFNLKSQVPEQKSAEYVFKDSFGTYTQDSESPAYNAFGSSHSEVISGMSLLDYEKSVLEAAHEEKISGNVRYIGRVFELFILVESENKLFIIDQHAAHERILYERMLSKPVLQQELLVPIPFDTDSGDQDSFLRDKSAELEKLGIKLAQENGSWQIKALPVLWRLGDKETVKEILALQSANENFASRWAATVSCHAAIRDGAYLDPEAALSLAQAALALPVQRCPHGRPILTEISRDEMFKSVQRS
jgi:DNA mismatch repair protein MutL